MQHRLSILRSNHIPFFLSKQTIHSGNTAILIFDLVFWRHLVTTWTNVDFSPTRYSGIHFSVIKSLGDYFWPSIAAAVPPPQPGWKRFSTFRETRSNYYLQTWLTWIMWHYYGLWSHQWTWHGILESQDQKSKWLYFRNGWSACLEKKDMICNYYIGVIISVLASQITGVSIVCSTVCSGADGSK